MARVSIEDCLNVLENRFALVTVAAARTRQLMTGDEALVKSKNKFAVTALREIAEGFVTARVPQDLSQASKAIASDAAPEVAALEVAPAAAAAPVEEPAPVTP